MAGERRRLPRDALHHAAVAAQRVHVVPEQVETRTVELPGHPTAGDRHADTGRHPLSQRAGRRLHAGGPAVFGVAGRLAVELTEALDVVERQGELAQPLVLGVHGLHAREREHRIEQQRGVAHREDEPIPVGPDGIVGIEAQELLPQTVDDRSHGHRGPGVPRLRRLHRVHRERADGVDGQAFEVARGHDQNKKRRRDLGQSRPLDQDRTGDAGEMIIMMKNVKYIVKSRNAVV